MFVLLILLILSAEFIFVHLTIDSSNTFLIFIASVQLISFVSSLTILSIFFRKRNPSNYRLISNGMGVFVTSFVPVFLFFPFSLVFLLTHSTILLYSAYILAALIFIGIIVGIIWSRWKWKTHKIDLSFDKLPQNADGLRIVQISDIHVGSFMNKYSKVEKAITQINHLNPDYVFFTGDLVNNVAEEMNGWESIFSKIRAKHGKFSILGNHDYGDYIQWSDEKSKDSNLQKLIDVHKQIGFHPLLNEAVELGNNFWLLGVENWGKPPFRQSGELLKTLKDVPEDSFKILLSHDPSHFDEEVCGKTTISLTLSGHTHGMQFGIERFGLKWSPVSFKYSKWAGLYRVGKQFLYVNRGFGFLGFPGRVGIYPEITLLTLHKFSK